MADISQNVSNSSNFRDKPMENLQSQKKIFVTTVSVYKTKNTKIVIIRKKKRYKQKCFVIKY